MSQTLTEIAVYLKNSKKKVNLIYAFNGVGKTRLSREFKELFALGTDEKEDFFAKVLYYNAFTEDLFYWDNDLKGDAAPKLIIQPNRFTDWILEHQGDIRIMDNFHRYTDKNLTPKFIRKESVQKIKGRNVKVKTYPEVSFTKSRVLPENTEETDIEIDDNNLVKRRKDESIKISKGEESNFIWSVFFTLLEEVVAILNKPDPSERDYNQYDKLEYVFIDDPVTSLDENHLIELAVDLARQIKSSNSGLKFIITTHSPLFYNVLHNELNLNKKSKKEGCSLLEKLEDGTYNLNVECGHSDKRFSYHLYLKQIIEKAIADNQIKKFHFMLLRNLYEKTAAFLGYDEWSDLLNTAEGAKEEYYKRIINFSSHSRLSNEEIAEPTEPEKQTLKLLLDNLTKYCVYSPKQE